MPLPTIELIGFDAEKTATVSRHLPAALDEIQKLLGKSVKFPSPIRPMTPREINHGQKMRPIGNPNGAGHGVWDSLNREVRINPTLSPDDMLINVVHELLHAVLPGVHELKIDDMTKQIMDKLNLMERSKSLYVRVMKGLSRKTLKRLRGGTKKKPSTISKPDIYLPGLIGNNDHPFNPSRGTMSGPGSFGPVSIGGIIRHS